MKLWKIGFIYDMIQFKADKAYGKETEETM